MIRIMGVLNVTPDSFSDGGSYPTAEAAVRHALDMVEAGALVIDVGAESTRPGFVPVPADEEIRRLLPVVSMLKQVTDAAISVDTVKTETAAAALSAGADIINDMNGLRSPGMAELIAEAGAGAVIAHSGGPYPDLHAEMRGPDTLGEIRRFLEERVACALDAGVPTNRIIVDPGVGFGKTMDDNIRIVDSSSSFSCGCPVLIGVSRKRVLARMYPGVDAEKATVMASLRAAEAGASMVRVHGLSVIEELHGSIIP